MSVIKLFILCFCAFKLPTNQKCVEHRKKLSKHVWRIRINDTVDFKFILIQCGKNHNKKTT